MAGISLPIASARQRAEAERFLNALPRDVREKAAEVVHRAEKAGAAEAKFDPQLAARLSKYDGSSSFTAAPKAIAAAALGVSSAVNVDGTRSADLAERAERRAAIAAEKVRYGQSIKAIPTQALARAYLQVADVSNEADIGRSWTWKGDALFAELKSRPETELRQARQELQQAAKPLLNSGHASEAAELMEQRNVFDVALRQLALGKK